MKDRLMPRARSIKPGFFQNEDMSTLTPLARLLFAGLWCWADRSGRLEDRPLKLKALILPYDLCDPEELLSALAAGGFIDRYEVAGVRVIQVDKFHLHQHPHPKEPLSDLPVNPAKVVENSAGRGKDTARTSIPSLPSLPSFTSLEKQTLLLVGGGGNGSNGSHDTSSRLFGLFWKNYPRKTGKDDAVRAWEKAAKRAGGDQALWDLCKAALAWQLNCRAWAKEDGQFIPYPATYLNRGSWKDEPGEDD